MTVVYMKVSNDEYELPEVIADSGKELSEKLGLHRTAVHSAIRQAKKNKSKCQYVKVVIDDGE